MLRGGIIGCWGIDATTHKQPPPPLSLPPIQPLNPYSLHDLWQKARLPHLNRDTPSSAPAVSVSAPTVLPTSSFMTAPPRVTAPVAQPLPPPAAPPPPPPLPLTAAAKAPSQRPPAPPTPPEGPPPPPPLKVAPAAPKPSPSRSPAPAPQAPPLFPALMALHRRAAAPAFAVEPGPPSSPGASVGAADASASATFFVTSSTTLRPKSTSKPASAPAPPPMPPPLPPSGRAAAASGRQPGRLPRTVLQVYEAADQGLDQTGGFALWEAGRSGSGSRYGGKPLAAAPAGAGANPALALVRTHSAASSVAGGSPLCTPSRLQLRQPGPGPRAGSFFGDSCEAVPLPLPHDSELARQLQDLEQGGRPVGLARLTALLSDARERAAADQQHAADQRAARGGAARR